MGPSPVCKEAKIVGMMCVHHFSSFPLCIVSSCPDFTLPANRPVSTPNAALCTLASQLAGITTFNALHPLTNSNLRMNDEERPILMPIRFNICSLMVGVGFSPRSKRHMRVRGRTVVNLEWYLGITRSDVNATRTCSAFPRVSLKSVGATAD
jgi:hypothetical protein